MVIKIAVFRIDWETDGESVPELPNKVVMDIDLSHHGGDVNKQICDHLGDEYGWLVNDYEIEGYSPEANYVLQYYSSRMQTLRE